MDLSWSFGWMRFFLYYQSMIKSFLFAQLFSMVILLWQLFFGHLHIISSCRLHHWEIAVIKWIELSQLSWLFFKWLIAIIKLTIHFLINLTIHFSVINYFTLLDQCSYSHNMDIKTFLVNISIFIKHFFNMALRALLLKNLSKIKATQATCWHRINVM